MGMKKPAEGLATGSTGNNCVGDQPDTRILSAIRRVVNRDSSSTCPISVLPTLISKVLRSVGVLAETCGYVAIRSLHCARALGCY